jgi:hypothetical protein
MPLLPRFLRRGSRTVHGWPGMGPRLDHVTGTVLHAANAVGRTHLDDHGHACNCVDQHCTSDRLLTHLLVNQGNQEERTVRPAWHLH